MMVLLRGTQGSGRGRGCVVMDKVVCGGFVIDESLLELLYATSGQIECLRFNDSEGFDIATLSELLWEAARRVQALADD